MASTSWGETPPWVERSAKKWLPVTRTPGRWPSSCASIGTHQRLGMGARRWPVDTRLPGAVRLHEHGHRAVAHLEGGLADRGAGRCGVGRPRQPPGHLGDDGQVGRVLEREHARLLLGLTAVGDVAQREHPAPVLPLAALGGRRPRGSAASPAFVAPMSSNGDGSPIRMRSARAARSAGAARSSTVRSQRLVGRVAERLREGRVDVDDLAVDVSQERLERRVPEGAERGPRRCRPGVAGGGWRVAAVRGGRKRSQRRYRRPRRPA